jgi:DNA (cytosine-5)-methyltransferase 1
MTPSVSNSQGNEYTRDRGQPGLERLTLGGQASQWQTPAAENFRSRGGGRKNEAGLDRQATTFWPTPNANDGRRPGADLKSTQGGNLSRDAVQWPTPAARDAKGANSATHALVTGGGRKHMDQLPNFVEHRFSSLLAQRTCVGAKSSTNSQSSRRRLNPVFGAWLMGWPLTWTIAEPHACAASAMAWWRQALRQHLSNLCAEPIRASSEVTL